MATQVHGRGGMKTRWLTVAISLAVVVPTGCATRQAAVDDPTYAAALTREVAEDERKLFPFGTAALLHGPAVVAPLAVSTSEILER
jgi:hypothetical protein